MKNIVIIGGGTGTFTLLAGLRKFPSNNTVIVSSADDGGSTGVLRRDLGVMPVGDIRQCLVGLSYTDDAIRDLFSYRFDRGALAGHTVGNIILAGLEKTTGTMEKAIAVAGALLNVRGAVLPVTTRPTTLSAVYADGRTVSGEHHIDEPTRRNATGITGLKLTPSVSASPRVLTALEQADAIVFGPGDLYTSVLPNLLPRGVVERIRASTAKKIVVANIMTKPGQTDGFAASDFVRVIGEYLSRTSGLRKNAPCLPDVALVNTKRPDAPSLAHYKKQGAAPVAADSAAIRAMGVEVIAGDMLSRRVVRRVAGDALTRSILRHDSDKTAKIIWKLLS